MADHECLLYVVGREHRLLMRWFCVLCSSLVWQQCRVWVFLTITETSYCRMIVVPEADTSLRCLKMSLDQTCDVQHLSCCLPFSFSLLSPALLLSKSRYFICLGFIVHLLWPYLLISSFFSFSHTFPPLSISPMLSYSSCIFNVAISLSKSFFCLEGQMPF